MRRIPLIIFAKIPEAGKVKTRLQPHCTAEQAQAIAKILLELTIENAVKNWSSEVVVSVWPQRSNAYIDSLVKKYPISLSYQSDGDLGKKMASAMNDNHWHAAIIGSDVPHLSAASLKSAYQELSKNNNVIGPSADGGYYLIGCSKFVAEIFDGPSWGDSNVLATSLAIAKQHQFEFEMLEQYQDIDNWQDLQHARAACTKLDQRLKELLNN